MLSKIIAECEAAIRIANNAAPDGYECDDAKRCTLIKNVFYRRGMVINAATVPLINNLMYESEG